MLGSWEGGEALMGEGRECRPLMCYEMQRRCGFMDAGDSKLNHMQNDTW